MLKAIDHLQSVGADVGALGVEAHLNHQGFITELDVLDDGLRGDVATIDAGVADAYRRYLDATLQVDAVKIVITFGLTDRYTLAAGGLPATRRPTAPAAAVRREPAAQARVRRDPPGVPERAHANAGVGRSTGTTT